MFNDVKIVNKSRNIPAFVRTKNYMYLWFNLNFYNSLRYRFKYITFNLFKLFFTNSRVDIPKVFLDFESLNRPSNQIKILKFNNYLMRDGKSLKTLIKLNNAWTNLVTINQTKYQLTFWYNTYFLLNNNLLSNTFIEQQVKTPSLSLLLSSFMSKHQSIFSLYIYKISKNIYKNTRGKSGKFMFIWKYVPVYKRLLIVISWMLRELRVIPQRNITHRLHSILSMLVNSPTTTWVNRVKMFSYNYVYRNCKKTLASTYISTKV
jgi:hypothetical protein